MIQPVRPGFPAPPSTAPSSPGPAAPPEPRDSASTAGQPASPELSGRQVAELVFGSKREDDKVAWRTRTPGNDAGWPEPCPGGGVLLSDGDGVVRLDADGNQLWRHPREQWTHARPVPTPDGGCVWAPGGGGLVALDAQGKPKWRWGQGLAMQTIQPAVGPDGTTYVCVKDEGWKLVAVGADGEPRWKAPLAMHASSPPVLHPDGRVSVRVDDSEDTRVATFDRDGHPVYQASVPGRVEGRLGLGPDGSIWVGNADGKLFQVTPEGRTREVFQARGALRGAPLVEADGRVFVTTMEGYVYGLKPDGTQAWRANPGGVLTSSVVRHPDGTLLVGGFDKAVHAFTPEGRPKWVVPLEFSGDDGVAAAPDGTVYVAGRNQVLALREGGIRVDLEHLPDAPEAGTIQEEGEWVTVGDIRLPVRSQDS